MIKALKPVSFSGKRFSVGDAIPESLILPERIKPLIEMGIIERDDTVPISNGQLKTERKVVEVFDPEKLKAATKQELIQLATDRGIDTTDLSKAQIISALTE